MNIDDFEKNLNQFPADTKKVINALLNISIKNQAMLEILLSFHTDKEYGFLKPKDKPEEMHEIADSFLKSRIAEIQAETTAKVYSED